MKLHFDNISSFNTFSLVLKRKKPKTKEYKRLTKLVRGICIKDEDNYNIKVDIKCLKPEIIDEGEPDVLLLAFTEDSYNLRGITSVFSRIPDKRGRYTRFMRDDSKSKFSPGNPDILVPFCNNWVCSGYIVRNAGKLMFEFHECIAPVGYTTIEHEDEK